MAFTRFESIGAFFPDGRQTTEELIASMSFTPPFSLETITGIRERRVCDKREDTFEDSFLLASAAARDCLSRSRYRADELDVIISASITRFSGGLRHQFEPSFSFQLSRALGADSALHFDVSNACAGMMSGVFALDRLIRAGVVRNGMVVSGECITPIADTAVKEVSQPWDPQFASLTVGDSGAAVILDESTSEADRIHYVELTTAADYSDLCIGKPSDLNPGVALYTNNNQMHNEDRVQLWPRFQMDYLAKRGSDFASEKYDYIVHHQVGQRAMRNFSKYGGRMFGAEMPEQLSVVEEHANTATTSHFVVLYKHLKEKRLRPGAKTLLVPAASGVVTGCLATTITSLEV